jgi:hypothetical protein
MHQYPTGQSWARHYSQSIRPIIIIYLRLQANIFGTTPCMIHNLDEHSNHAYSSIYGTSVLMTRKRWTDSIRSERP